MGQQHAERRRKEAAEDDMSWWQIWFKSDVKPRVAGSVQTGGVTKTRFYLEASR